MPTLEDHRRIIRQEVRKVLREELMPVKNALDIAHPDTKGFAEIARSSSDDPAAPSMRGETPLPPPPRYAQVPIEEMVASALDCAALHEGDKALISLEDMATCIAFGATSNPRNFPPSDIREAIRYSGSFLKNFVEQRRGRLEIVHGYGVGPDE